MAATGPCKPLFGFDNVSREAGDALRLLIEDATNLTACSPPGHIPSNIAVPVHQS